MQYGIPVDAYFVTVKRDPGPPYGKAYGYWKKHKHDRGTKMVLADVDVRNLVAVRMAHEYYGVPVEVAMEWRSGGRNLADVMSDEYQKRHGKGHSGSKGKTSAKSHPGKGHGKKKK